MSKSQLSYPFTPPPSYSSYTPPTTNTTGKSTYVGTPISTPISKPTTSKKSLITPGFFPQYMPFIVFIGIALLLLVSIAFIPSRTITKLFAASTAIAWASFWATVIYLLCLGGNTFIAWFLMFLPLGLWFIITVMVFIGAIKLDTVTTVV